MFKTFEYVLLNTETDKNERHKHYLHNIQKKTPNDLGSVIVEKLSPNVLVVHENGLRSAVGSTA